MAKFPVRAVMLDPARLMDRKEEYFRMLPHLAEWGYNLLHWHITDDQGCRIVFPSAPELASEGAFTLEETRRFVAEAKSLGIDVMPEIEALGHAGYISRVPGYEDLVERPSKDYWAFNAMCPCDDRVKDLLGRLIADAAELFEYPVLHVGLDEAHFDPACPRCGGADQTDLFGRHAAWVHAECRRRGRRPAMWADHPLKDRRLLDFFERDVLMFDWRYTPINPFHETLEVFTGKGFEAVACPATASAVAGMGPSMAAMQNIRIAAAAAEARLGKGVLGADNTVWVPWRFLAGAIDPLLAFAGHLFNSEESEGFADSFASSFYGLPDGGAFRALFDTYVPLADRNQFYRVLDGTGDRETRRYVGSLDESFARTAEALENAASLAARNTDRLGDIALMTRVWQAFARRAAGRSPALDTSLRRKVEEAWVRVRPEETLRTHGHSREDGVVLKDCLLCNMEKLAE